MIHHLYPGLILRMAGAAVTSFLLVIVLGPRMIHLLVRRKLGDRPEFNQADLNQLSRHKSRTPTMGGILIVIAIFVSVVAFANLNNFYIRMGLLTLVWLGALGAADDWIKLRRTSDGGRDGLKAWEKMAFQVGLAVLLSIFIRDYGSESHVRVPGTAEMVNPAHSLYAPFWSRPIYLPMGVYVAITVLTMVGTCNAVNLTDGMDGLATGNVLIVTGVMLVLSWIVGVARWSEIFELPLVAGSAEMTILCAAILGACLGFLWYNAPPAQVFMGDTGSLALGGLIGYVAVVTRQELLLLIAGGVFVMEAGSVILQVGYYKLTKSKRTMEGKRIFLCAPLHHHYHLAGWPETRVVSRFWILGVIFAALALATLKLR